MTPVADAEPSAAFSRNQAELEQMRDAVTSLTAGVGLRPRQEVVVGPASAPEQCAVDEDDHRPRGAAAFLVVLNPTARTQTLRALDMRAPADRDDFFNPAVATVAARSGRSLGT